ncbi:MAG: flagellar biosynthesis protein FliQ [Pseudomonadota bacterium]|nr:flagellar biosynthesis protein FliQ [Pseudomonadota bacterium]
MTPNTVMNLGTTALEVTLMLSLPLLLAALVTGVIVGAFQAATQINEMTLSFIPKLLVLALVVALTGPWMLHTMVEYTRELIMSIPQLVN